MAQVHPMVQEQNILYPSLFWLKLIALISLLTTSSEVLSTEIPNKNLEIKDQPVAVELFKKTTRLKKVKHKPWYTKMNYFVSLEKKRQTIAISRIPESLKLNKELFKANYNPAILSFTAGGNLFPKTSVHMDLTFTQFTLEGVIYDANEESVYYQRNKSLGEVFVEHDLGKGITIGFDLYYGGDFYRDEGDDEKYYDQELGGGLLAARSFKLGSSDARLDYIFSHRRVNVGSLIEGKISNSFHNLLFNLSHQWTYELTTIFSTRLSYYPDFDLSNYWDARYVTSIATEIRYNLWDTNEISLRIERMNFAGSSHINGISLRFEHQFGAKKSKRRKRRRKAPQLLIK